jgi:hypothetical protein
MDIIQNDNGRLLKISENKRSTHNTVFNLNVKLYNDQTCSFFSATIDGWNLIFDHKLHIGTFPLEFFNFITDVQSFKIISNIWPVKFFIINIIPFILTFWYWFFIQYFLYNFNLHVFCINNLLYSQLIDRRNCISEYSKIKKCIPKDYLKFLKNENNDIENKTKSRNKMK